MQNLRICNIFWLVALLIPGQTIHAAAPKNWQIGFQNAASPVMEQLVSFHNLMLIIIACIAILVIGLIFWVIWRYRASKNPTPQTWSHNVTLEVIWTLLPVVILLFMAYPSFRLLYYMDATPQADMTIKVIGKQWYWTYEYPDHGNFSFDSYLVPEKDLKPDQLRLLSVDNPVYVPVNKKIRILTTANDVIHSWALPAMGVKKDCVPGRINETWFMATKPGVYYGQCSELCGPKHGMMPIEVHVVSEEAFNQWVEQARKKYE